MGVCISVCKNGNQDLSEVPVISSKQNQKGGKKLKRVKTKFPKKGKNVSDDDEDEEEKNQEKKEENKDKKEKNKSKEENNLESN